MAEKNEVVIDTKLIDQLSRRVGLANDSFQEFSSSKNKLDGDIEKRKKEFAERIKRVHKDLDDIKDATKKLRDSVFSMGSTLTDRVTKRDFEKFKAKIDAWNLEDTMHRPELERSFNKYNDK